MDFIAATAILVFASTLVGMIFIWYVKYLDAASLHQRSNRDEDLAWVDYLIAMELNNRVYKQMDYQARTVDRDYRGEQIYIALDDDDVKKYTRQVTIQVCESISRPYMRMYVRLYFRNRDRFVLYVGQRAYQKISEYAFNINRKMTSEKQQAAREDEMLNRRLEQNGLKQPEKLAQGVDLRKNSTIQ